MDMCMQRVCMDVCSYIFMCVCVCVCVCALLVREILAPDCDHPPPLFFKERIYTTVNITCEIILPKLCIKYFHHGDETPSVAPLSISANDRPSGIILFWGEFRSLAIIQCVPIKRKPVLSVGYLHCHGRFNQTTCFIIKGIFSSFIWYQTHDDISMHDWKGTIWTHACQNRFAQNNGVELIWPSSDYLIHVRIRSLSRRNMTKETKETKEMLMNVFSTRPFVLKRGRPR